MLIKQEIVTPDYAKSILENSGDNRLVSSRLVDSLADQMRAGKWVSDSNDLVMIDETGALINGQHRMNAVIKSGVSVLMLVARGANAAVMDYLDAGRPRRIGDTLTIKGVKYANKRAATYAGAYKLLYRRNKLSMAAYEDVDCVFSKHWEKIESFYSSGKAGKVLKMGAATALLLLRYNFKSSEVDAFIDRICEGANLDAGSNELKLRNKLLEIKVTSGGTRVNIAYLVMWTYIQTMNGVRMSKMTISNERVDALLEQIRKRIDQSGKITMAIAV